jgi:hypothetical protein
MTVARWKCIEKIASLRSQLSGIASEAKQSSTFHSSTLNVIASKANPDPPDCFPGSCREGEADAGFEFWWDV